MVDTQNTKIEESKQCRWKSVPLWTGIFGGLVMAYNAIAEAYELPSVDNNLVVTIINAVAAILVGFGIINNPTDSKNL